MLLADFAMEGASNAHRLLQIAKIHPFFGEIGDAIMSRCPFYPKKVDEEQRNKVNRNEVKRWKFVLSSKLDWAHLSAWSRLHEGQVIEELQVSFHGDSPAPCLLDFTNLLRFLHQRKHSLSLLVVYIEHSEMVTSMEYRSLRNAAGDCGITRLHVTNAPLQRFEIYQSWKAAPAYASYCTIELYYCEHSLNDAIYQLLRIYADLVVDISLHYACRACCYKEFTLIPRSPADISSFKFPEDLSFPLLATLSIGEETMTIDSLHSVLSRTPLVSFLCVIPSSSEQPLPVCKPAPTPSRSIFLPATITARAPYAKKFFANLEDPSPSSTVQLRIPEDANEPCANLDFLEHATNIDIVSIPPSRDKTYFITRDGLSFPHVKELTLAAPKAFSHDTKTLTVCFTFLHCLYTY